MKILIINGPNLNLLGTREPSIYGNISFDDFLKSLQLEFNNHEISYLQSNHEGVIIDAIHDAVGKYDGIILNAGGYTHTSVSIADALAATKQKVVEVHISNVFAREPFRHVSLIGPHCCGVIGGFGLESYRMAVRYLVNC